MSLIGSLDSRALSTPGFARTDLIFEEFISEDEQFLSASLLENVINYFLEQKNHSLFLSMITCLNDDNFEIIKKIIYSASIDDVHAYITNCLHLTATKTPEKAALYEDHLYFLIDPGRRDYMLKESVDPNLLSLILMREQGSSRARHLDKLSDETKLYFPLASRMMRMCPTHYEKVIMSATLYSSCVETSLIELVEYIQTHQAEDLLYFVVRLEYEKLKYWMPSPDLFQPFSNDHEACKFFANSVRARQRVDRPEEDIVALFIQHTRIISCCTLPQLIEQLQSYKNEPYFNQLCSHEIKKIPPFILALAASKKSYTLIFKDWIPCFTEEQLRAFFWMLSTTSVDPIFVELKNTLSGQPLEIFLSVLPNGELQNILVEKRLAFLAITESCFETCRQLLSVRAESLEEKRGLLGRVCNFSMQMSEILYNPGKRVWLKRFKDLNLSLLLIRSSLEHKSQTLRPAIQAISTKDVYNFADAIPAYLNSVFLKALGLESHDQLIECGLRTELDLARFNITKANAQDANCTEMTILKKYIGQPDLANSWERLRLNGIYSVDMLFEADLVEDPEDAKNLADIVKKLR